MKTWYTLLDIAFSIATVYFLLNSQLTNALISWAIAELYAVQRKQFE